MILFNITFIPVLKLVFGMLLVVHYENDFQCCLRLYPWSSFLLII